MFLKSIKIYFVIGFYVWKCKYDNERYFKKKWNKGLKIILCIWGFFYVFLIKFLIFSLFFDKKKVYDI